MFYLMTRKSSVTFWSWSRSGKCEILQTLHPSARVIVICVHFHWSHDHHRTWTLKFTGSRNDDGVKMRSYAEVAIIFVAFLVTIIPSSLAIQVIIVQYWFIIDREAPAAILARINGSNLKYSKQVSHYRILQTCHALVVEFCLKLLLVNA